MAKQSFKTAVGAFVIGGLALLVAGIILLGGGRMFSDDIEYVLYFDGSVSGLNIGAPVVFRGVPMGQVTRISLEANPRDASVTIPVYIRLDENSIVRAGVAGELTDNFRQEILRRLIQRGLRARLQLQSLITGQYRVELDFLPNTPANFRSPMPDREIPTLPSPIDTKYLIGDFKRYGQELNDVQSGLEQAVQEQMKAEHLKTELITNVSHDIKTPLTSIVNYVDLLKKEDIPSPEAREYIAVLDRQSHRLKKLTEDLVEASKASSGVLNVDLQPTDVNVLFSQIEGEYQERLAACQLTLVTQPPAPGTVIRADSRLLSRVMDNLVSNICKYALPSTRVYVVSTLSREAVTISFKNVSRDELNISPDELMERFVRGDASRHTEGSGLGLSIARSLVQLQGGRFDLAIDADLFRADITFPLSESAAS